MTDSSVASLVGQAERFLSVRRLTEALAEPLSAEDQTVQSMPDVSPTKWHRAHTSWFFETFLLAPSLPGYRLFDPTYGYLFNSYYEAVGSRHPRAERGLLSRPGIADIAAYRRYVDQAMGSLFEAVVPGAPLAELAELGIHHEQQHQELLMMDIKHVLSRNPQQPQYRGVGDPPTSSIARPGPPGWLTHPGGPVEIGAGPDGFAFDNERPRHQELLGPVAVADRPVTCGDWLEFMADGGYERPEFWLSDGWAAVRSGALPAPLYWTEQDGAWSVFTLHGPRPVDPHEPICHVSYFEADAYAHWAGARLPTEIEWEAVLAPYSRPTGLTMEAITDDRSLLHPTLASTSRPHVGQVWEWTASAYLPYPGFVTAPGAVGEYNGKFMVNQHVLRGGCWATPAGHLRPTYRNFFPPAARWPFTGLRLAKSI